MLTTFNLDEYVYHNLTGPSIRVTLNWSAQPQPIRGWAPAVLGAHDHEAQRWWESPPRPRPYVMEPASSSLRPVLARSPARGLAGWACPR
jgi:hypothetical protein